MPIHASPFIMRRRCTVRHCGPGTQSKGDTMEPHADRLAAEMPLRRFHCFGKLIRVESHRVD